MNQKILLIQLLQMLKVLLGIFALAILKDWLLAT